MSELSGALKRILDIVREQPVTIDELAEKAGIKKTTARKYLDQLVRLGYLIKGDDGRYYAKVEEKPREEPRSCEKPREERKVVEVDLSNAFYFARGAQIVPLAIRSVKQLWAAIAYGFVDGEALREAIDRGYLQAWIRNVLGLEDLAVKLDELRGLDPASIAPRALDILKQVVEATA